MAKLINTFIFINRAEVIHKDKYDYSKVNYTKSSSKVTIICREHGEFSQIAANHLQGRGCPQCAEFKRRESKKLKFKDFLKKVSDLHENKYQYDELSYQGILNPVKIICPEHGSFEQTPHVHLRGHGCSKCAGKFNGLIDGEWNEKALISKNFDSFKVYIIRCWNEGEEFYKIGKTFSTIKYRFDSKKKMPYNYEIESLYVFEDYKKCCELERQLQKNNKEFKYVPKIKFSGISECFKKVNNGK